jgi:hypothetical protein
LALCNRLCPRERSGDRLCDVLVMSFAGDNTQVFGFICTDLCLPCGQHSISKIPHGRNTATAG